ncbi:unnamed protein product [Linum trigynum]|uniref:Heat shock protein 70 n=1 Tax=Linum trigynum TaxID=586398 RepID=A0AAV2D1K0_9ROSI
MGAQNSKAEAAVAYAKAHGGDDEESLKQNKQDLVYPKTPLSIGSDNIYGDMLVRIPKNTTIPTRKFEFVSTTASDFQESVKISFYQGERKKASANQLLGVLVFEGIPPAPMGVAKVKICVDIDAKGNLNVSAEDKSTGRKATMSIPGVGVRGKFLTTEEVEKMARQGEKHKSEDEEHTKEVNAMIAMKEYAYLVRENAAAGAYSWKADDAFRDAFGKMLGEFNEKAKEFGLEGDKKRCEA